MTILTFLCCLKHNPELPFLPLDLRKLLVFYIRKAFPFLVLHRSDGSIRYLEPTRRVSHRKRGFYGDHFFSEVFCIEVPPESFFAVPKRGMRHVIKFRPGQYFDDILKAKTEIARLLQPYADSGLYSLFRDRPGGAKGAPKLKPKLFLLSCYHSGESDFTRFHYPKNDGCDCLEKRKTNLVLACRKRKGNTKDIDLDSSKSLIVHVMGRKNSGKLMFKLIQDGRTLYKMY